MGTADLSIASGVPMPAATSTRAVRQRMPLDEFLALPADVHAEYVDGVAIVSPPPDIPHQALAARLVVLFAGSLPDLVPVAEAGLLTVRDGHRVPDVMLLRAEEQAVWAEQRPVVVVEITSSSTRTEDTLRKPGEYARAGVGQYWLLDRDRRTLTVLADEDGDGVPTVVVELDDGRPVGDVAVGESGVVHVDLRTLLAPSQASGAQPAD